MKFLISFFAALALPIAMLGHEPSDTTTIFTIGDSTMANKPLDKENQERGWGQMLPIYLQGPVKVDNHAVNGRSSKSFIDEGRWETVLNLIRQGDYVIIQFGHNDEKIKSPDRYTEAGTTFDANLAKYVTEAREKGATPILMNSIVRRNFPADQEVAETDDRQKTWKEGFENYPKEGEILVDTHGAYREAPKHVADSLGVTFIDMNALTHELVQELGPERSREMFMWIPANTYEFCPNGKIDNTHLNILGGILVSRLAVNALAEQVPELRQFIRPEIYNLNH
ncbi:MAG: rhamnogalacturonan acetylesterase [Bacteroidales bacterium]|nr:rhamnogalacturonan acetylesterase [Bacteroidales bacterium]